MAACLNHRASQNFHAVKCGIKTLNGHRNSLKKKISLVVVACCGANSVAKIRQQFNCSASGWTQVFKCDWNKMSNRQELNTAFAYFTGSRACSAASPATLSASVQCACDGHIPSDRFSASPWDERLSVGTFAIRGKLSFLFCSISINIFV